MTARDELTREMRQAGFSQDAIDAAWPSWWTDEAETSPSSRAELRFALSRRLGLAAKPLLGERVEFFWDDSARFKHLRVHNDSERGALASFGIALGRDVISATEAPNSNEWHAVTALGLRDMLLKSRPFVDLQSIVITCWSFGIPVIHLNVVPLEAKSMHAMVVQYNGRFAILLARKARYPAMVAFTLAHELGHILLGHLGDSSALVDLEDPVEEKGDDAQENEADAFALELLTGRRDPVIESDVDEFNAPTLAQAALDAAPQYGVEPGTIALTLAHRDGSWARTMSAMNFIYRGTPPISKGINLLAEKQLDWTALSDEATDYIERVIGE